MHFMSIGTESKGWYQYFPKECCYQKLGGARALRRAVLEVKRAPMVIKVKTHWAGLFPTWTTLLGTGSGSTAMRSSSPQWPRARARLTLAPNSCYSNVLIKILRDNKHETGKGFQWIQRQNIPGTQTSPSSKLVWPRQIPQEKKKSKRLNQAGH